jgi:hypothetical protein
MAGKRILETERLLLRECDEGDIVEFRGQGVARYVIESGVPGG